MSRFAGYKCAFLEQEYISEWVKENFTLKSVLSAGLIFKPWDSHCHIGLYIRTSLPFGENCKKKSMIFFPSSMQGRFLRFVPPTHVITNRQKTSHGLYRNTIVRPFLGYSRIRCYWPSFPLGLWHVVSQAVNKC